MAPSHRIQYTMKRDEDRIVDANWIWHQFEPSVVGKARKSDPFTKCRPILSTKCSQATAVVQIHF